IVDAYKMGVIEEAPEQLFNTTLAVIDLSRIDMVIDSLNNFFYNLIQYKVSSISDLIAVEIAVDRSEAYGKSDPFFEGGEFFDLYNIAQYLSFFNNDIKLSFLADNVRASLDSIIYYKWSAPEKPHSHGLSIWWPMEELVYTDKINNYRDTKFAADTNWDEFLSSYKNLKASDIEPPTVTNVTASSYEVHPGTPITITAEVADNYLVKTAYLISFLEEGGTLYAISISPRKEIYYDCTAGMCPGVVEFQFDALGTTLSDGTQEYFFPTFWVTDRVILVTGTYVEGEAARAARVYFNANNGNMIAMYLIDEEFSEYTPQPGSLFYPHIYIYNDAQGDIVPVESIGLIATSLRIRTGMAFPSGDYTLAVVASDFSDNENLSEILITVP
ncbi:MAG: hypothetical protein ABIM21_05100, partial [candidate division WOR-3 bacterium]